MTLLEIIIALPLLSATLVLIAGGTPGRARILALTGSVAALTASSALLPAGAMSGTVLRSSAGPGAWTLECGPLAAPLVLLAAVLGVVAVAASWTVETRPRTHFALLLFLQAAVTGVFLAEDLVLFYVFWEAVLIPMFFLIGGWGHENRRHAAMKFFLFTFAGSALMLAGIVAAVYRTRAWTITEISAAAGDGGLGTLVFWLIMAGLLVKIPVVPLHTWLPDAHVEAPTAGSIMLAGVLLKMGAYGILRVAIPLAEPAFVDARALLAVLGVVAIVWGAAMALVQDDLKRVVAYASVSHMGFVVLAIAAYTPLSIAGSLIAMVSHGLVAALLFFLVGSIYERAHTRDMRRFGGFGKLAPRWSVAFVFASLASLGLPGLSGFPGELISIIESYARFGAWIAFVGVGLVLAAAYNLRAVRNTVHGSVGETTSLADLGTRESLTVAGLAVLIVVIGVWPGAVAGSLTDSSSPDTPALSKAGDGL